MKFNNIHFFICLLVLNAFSLSIYAQNKVSLNSSDIVWKVKPQAEVGQDSLKMLAANDKTFKTNKNI